MTFWGKKKMLITGLFCGYVFVAGVYGNLTSTYDMRRYDDSIGMWAEDPDIVIISHWIYDGLRGQFVFPRDICLKLLKK